LQRPKLQDQKPETKDQIGNRQPEMFLNLEVFFETNSLFPAS
jgi:hypothetical protein